jgi:hypothetical protein
MVVKIRQFSLFYFVLFSSFSMVKSSRCRYLEGHKLITEPKMYRIGRMLAGSWLFIRAAVEWLEKKTHP